jgi:hypothetical protein
MDKKKPENGEFVCCINHLIANKIKNKNLDQGVFL